MGKAIYWEWCEGQKFDNTNKWDVYKPEHKLENETHIIRWDFETQTDNPTPARKPYLELINKKKERVIKRICHFIRSLSEKKKIKNIYKYLHLAKEPKKLWNIKVAMIPITVGTLATVLKETEGNRYQRKNRDHIDPVTIKISWKSWKSPGNLRKVAITLTRKRDHQLELVRKHHKE